MLKKTRRRASVLVAAVATGMLVLGSAGAAFASGYSQQRSHDASVTGLGLTGNGLYVSDLEVRHDEGWIMVNVCGSRATAWGTLHAGGSWSKTFGYEAGCIFHGVNKFTKPNVNFKAGTTVKGQMYHDGLLRAGIPQVGIS